MRHLVLKERNVICLLRRVEHQIEHKIAAVVVFAEICRHLIDVVAIGSLCKDVH